MNKTLKYTLIGTSLVGLVYLGNIGINLVTYNSCESEYNQVKQKLGFNRERILTLILRLYSVDEEYDKPIKKELMKTRAELEGLYTKLNNIEILADTRMKEIEKSLDYTIKPWLYLKEKPEVRSK